MDLDQCEFEYNLGMAFWIYVRMCEVLSGYNNGFIV